MASGRVGFRVLGAEGLGEGVVEFLGGGGEGAAGVGFGSGFLVGAGEEEGAIDAVEDPDAVGLFDVDEPAFGAEGILGLDGGGGRGGGVAGVPGDFEGPLAGLAGGAAGDGESGVSLFVEGILAGFADEFGGRGGGIGLEEGEEGGDEQEADGFHGARVDIEGFKGV